MPRKPNPPKKQTITILVKGIPIAVTLHPPTGARASWFAYWNGLRTSMSTGQRNLEDAIIVAEDMVKNDGKRADLQDTVVSDDEFEDVQRQHFGRITDEQAKRRSDKSLNSCLEAISAFREITGLTPITLATADDCARFQRHALKLPRRWRAVPLESRRAVEDYFDEARELRQKSGNLDVLDDCPRYSPNSVTKWSRTLQAAFERVNCNALKRKCVRGVVDERKLLNFNPWNHFTWIKGAARPIRQFDSEELLSCLAYFETAWGGVPIGTTVAKTFLWSSCRKMEISSLSWESCRIIGKEYHFEIVGKHGIERWFRVPEALYLELKKYKTDSPFVFAAHNEQLRRIHAHNPNWLRLIGDEFTPEHLARWFYKRIKDWSVSNPRGNAFVHIFRKTTLQYARQGEDVNRQVARDAKVSESVLMTNYVKEEDQELRARSNRTFNRIMASLSPDVARAYGAVEAAPPPLEQQLQVAMGQKDWQQVRAISARLATQDSREVT